MTTEDSKPIIQILKELGLTSVSLQREEAKTSCPSGRHEDKSPSWYINIETGLHHCFSCDYSGNLPGLVADLKKIPYTEAVSWCNGKIGWAKAQQWRTQDHNIPEYKRLSESSLALFTGPPDDMLAEKRITREAANEFEVLWNPSQSQWIFPIRNPEDQSLWGWQLKNGRIFRSYPAGIKKSETLFGIRAFTDGSTPVLVESPIDAVRLYASGVRGGLSSLGVQVSDKQLSFILSRSDSIILALDNDLAGVQETARICRVYGQIPTIRIFNYGASTGKDPGELTQEEVLYGIDNAHNKIRWLRQYNALERELTPVPGRTGLPVSFPKELASRFLNGAR